jgi:hypothetical protein
MDAVPLVWSRIGRVATASGLLVLLLAAMLAWRAMSAGAAAPVLTLAPGPSGGAFHDGQSISVSVGPNSVFAPNARIVILQCAAPNGVLPVDDSTCDGNTVQGDSVLVGGDGSFTEGSYILYRLPSPLLNEQANHLPDCDASHQCVLYVGEDQNDFTKPKLFSVPFTFSASGGSTTPTTAAPAGGAGGAGAAVASAGAGSAAGTGPDGAGSSGSTSAGASNPQVSLSPGPGSLAFTGPPVLLPWLVGTGTLLLFGGGAARLLCRAVAR